MNPVILSNKDKNFNREELNRYIKRSCYLQEDFYEFCKNVLDNRCYKILKGEEDVVDDVFFNTEWALDRRDDRTALEFARNLIINKVYEEFNKIYFNTIYNSGLEYTATEGTDILETNNDISNYPDFRSRKGCLVEFIKLETGYWCKQEKSLYFRHYKIKKLKELAEKQRVFLIVALIEEIEYQIIEITPDTPIFHQKSIKRFNGKWGYKINFEPNFKPYYDIKLFKEKQIKMPVIKNTYKIANKKHLVGGSFNSPPTLFN